MGIYARARTHPQPPVRVFQARPLSPVQAAVLPLLPPSPRKDMKWLFGRLRHGTFLEQISSPPFGSWGGVGEAFWASFPWPLSCAAVDWERPRSPTSPFPCQSACLSAFSRKGLLLLKDPSCGVWVGRGSISQLACCNAKGRALALSWGLFPSMSPPLKSPITSPWTNGMYPAVLSFLSRKKQGR